MDDSDVRPRFHIHLGEPRRPPWGTSELRNASAWNIAALVSAVAPALLDDHGIPFEIHEYPGGVWLTIPPMRAAQYPIVIDAHSDGVNIWTDTLFHVQFIAFDSTREVVGRGLGFVRDALTSGTRICIHSWGDDAYRADFQTFEMGRWRWQASVLAPELRFWKPRRTSYWLNDRLSVRGSEGNAV